MSRRRPREHTFHLPSKTDWVYGVPGGHAYKAPAHIAEPSGQWWNGPRTSPVPPSALPNRATSGNTVDTTGRTARSHGPGNGADGRGWAACSASGFTLSNLVD